MDSMFNQAKAFNGDVSVLAVCVVLCVCCVPNRVLSLCVVVDCFVWTNGVCLGRVDVSRACTFKYAESMLLGSRDKERDVEYGFCFGHGCTSGETLFTRRGG